jgi:PhnB protein
LKKEKTMSLTTYLAFAGDCQAAFETYERVLGGKITFKMTNGESPDGGQNGSGDEGQDHAHFAADA